MVPGSERGAGTVEHVGLLALVAALVIASALALAGGPPAGGVHQLGGAIARKSRCAAALPDPCWQDPLTVAYGRRLAGAVRALAPVPVALRGRGGALLLPVDFRRCRRESCAMPGGASGLTAGGRRVTAFTSVADTADRPGAIRITYWSYRPGLGWARAGRAVSPARVDALAATPLLDDANPRLVPLETLPGRNHVDFPPGEEPPWRWRIPGRYQ